MTKVLLSGASKLEMAASGETEFIRTLRCGESFAKRSAEYLMSCAVTIRPLVGGRGSNFWPGRSL
jgi:hypothetical protein